MAGQTGVAAFGFVGYKLEATKGVFVTPDEFLFVTTHGLNAVADVIRKEVISGTRVAQRIIKPAKFKLTGAMGHPLYGNMGTPLFKAGLGQETYLSPVSTTGSGFVNTSSDSDTGVTTITVASATGLIQGAWITIGAGANQEFRTIARIAGSVISVKQLANNHTTDNAIVQVAQHQFTTRAPNAASVTSGGPFLSAPSAPVPSTSATGGTILAGAYGVEVTYINAQGQTTASASGTVTTTGTTSTITVPSPAAAGSGAQTATGFYTYITQPGGATFTLQGGVTAIGTSFVLSTPPSTSGTNPPTANTAGTTTQYIPIGQDLPTVSIETNEGGLWSWQWAGCYVGKINMKAGKEDVEVTEDIMGTVLPVRRDRNTTPPMTALAPTVDEINDTINPYIINDGYVMVESDPDATGTSGLTYLPTLESWEVDYDNGMIEKAYWDGKRVYKVFPGVIKSVIKYMYSNEAIRPAEWEDFVDKDQTQYVPFYASMSVNTSTDPANPTWRGFGVAIPNAVITKAEPTRAIGDVIGMSIEADATVGPSGDNILTYFVVNAKLTSYA